ncbi:MAG TPA: hypothetical protein VGV36_00945 [Solirubrobacteraceae bacterium]|nr:hypothetical protein [Solirubrobacteraceae bacterium]
MDGQRYLGSLRRPSHLTRAAAWLVTGPVGHLVAGVVDWVVLLVALLRERSRLGAARAGRARCGDG